jgi:crotonobetainyl-CoA:carnitine CoA-transferase CaiB-like acyl-CoA transferase
MTGAKYQFYECADRKNVLFCAIEHKFWDQFCRVVGHEELVAQKNTTTPVDYGTDPQLRLEVQRIFHTRTQAEWMELAIEHKLPIGPAPRDITEMRHDPHVRHRGLIFEADHPAAGAFTYIGDPALVRDHPYQLRYSAPTLGEHTREVLGQVLGMSDTEIDALYADAIIA